MLGTTLRGRYHIIRKLGSGSFGETYVTEDWDLPGHPHCVVKQLKPNSTETFVLETGKRLFEKEAEILQRLGTHARIPRLLAHFEENREFYLVEEFIPGNDLSQEIVTGKQWSEAEVISLLQDILEVLAFVHQQQVIHRDIKPENLIRRQLDGKICLIDFGAVKEIAHLGVNSQGQVGTTVTIGTRGYMPDEQANGKPTKSSDVYAVGIIAIEALTGLDSNPKRGGLPIDASTGEIRWRDKAMVSDTLAEIIDRMVKNDWRQRYASAVEALQALQSLSQSMNPNVPSPIQPSPDPGTTQPPLTSPPAPPQTVVSPAPPPAAPNHTSSAPTPPPSRSRTSLWDWPREHKMGFIGICLTVLFGVLALPIVQRRLGLDAPSQIASSFSNYNSFEGFKIKYPESWRKDEKSDIKTGKGVIFTAPDINLEVEVSPNTLTYDAYTNRAIEQIRQFVAEAKIEKEGETSLGNSPAYQVIYTGKREGKAFKRLQLWTLKNGKVYVVTYSAENGKYDEQLKTAEAMIDSFEIN